MQSPSAVQPPVILPSVHWSERSLKALGPTMYKKPSLPPKPAPLGPKPTLQGPTFAQQGSKPTLQQLAHQAKLRRNIGTTERQVSNESQEDSQAVPQPVNCALTQSATVSNNPPVNKFQPLNQPNKLNDSEKEEIKNGSTSKNDVVHSIQHTKESSNTDMNTGDTSVFDEKEPNESKQTERQSDIAARTQRSLTLLEEAKRKLEYYHQSKKLQHDILKSKFDSTVLDNYKHYAVPLSQTNNYTYTDGNSW